MGVMACDRNGCENIMCDRHSHIHGHLCDSCFDELVNTGPFTNVFEFMKSHKNETVGLVEEAEARYNVIFKLST